MSLPRYPKYKDSGVEWLGEVPEHWRTAKLKWKANIYAGGTPDKSNLNYWENGTIPWINSGSVNQQPVTEASTFITEEALKNSSARWVPTGALVIALAGQGKTKGTVSQLAITATCNQSMAAIIPERTLIERFLYWWLTANYQNLRNLSGGDLREGLNLELLGDVCCPICPEAEQEAISQFLDCETAKIDDLIAEQQRLIELLKEKRQAVISHAVTKGLNSDAPMKDSGIEWLGYIPTHWTVQALRRFPCVVQTGPFGSQLHADEYLSGGTPVINPVNLVGGRIIPSEDVTVSDDVVNRLGHQRLQVGDIVFSRRGELGRCALVSENEAGWLCGTGSMIVRLRHESYLADYLSLFLSLGVLRQYFESCSVGSIMDSLSSQTLLAMPMVVPPPEEQTGIVAFVVIESLRLNSIIESATRAIDLLQERRTALISAAVTGKIDVRQAVKKKLYSTGFARQLLAAEILYRFHDHQTMGRVKLQKLLHLCEHVAQIDELGAEYERQAAGPFDNKLMFSIASGLKKQGWFEDVKDAGRTIYRPLQKAGEHKKYLAHWDTKMPEVDRVLALLGAATTQQCEIVSTLYAAWNDLLIEGHSPADDEIIREASSSDHWHASKEKIDRAKWANALRWMKEKNLIPTGWGRHTKHRTLQEVQM